MGSSFDYRQIYRQRRTISSFFSFDFSRGFFSKRFEIKSVVVGLVFQPGMIKAPSTTASSGVLFDEGPFCTSPPVFRQTSRYVLAYLFSSTCACSSTLLSSITLLLTSSFPASFPKYQPKRGGRGRIKRTGVDYSRHNNFLPTCSFVTRLRRVPLGNRDHETRARIFLYHGTYSPENTSLQSCSFKGRRVIISRTISKQLVRISEKVVNRCLRNNLTGVESTSDRTIHEPRYVASRLQEDTRRSISFLPFPTGDENFTRRRQASNYHDKIGKPVVVAFRG